MVLFRRTFKLKLISITTSGEFEAIGYVASVHSLHSVHQSWKKPLYFSEEKYRHSLVRALPFLCTFQHISDRCSWMERITSCFTSELYFSFCMSLMTGPWITRIYWRGSSAKLISTSTTPNKLQISHQTATTWKPSWCLENIFNLGVANPTL